MARLASPACAGILFFFCLTSCVSTHSPTADTHRDAASPLTATRQEPRLVVVVSVDQMRADFLAPQRLGPGGALMPGIAPLYTKGFKSLLEDGVVFTNAQHLHALTETAPGHAVISTGQHPRHHGIVSNDWRDRSAGGRTVNAVDDPKQTSVPSGIAQGDKRSPINLLRPACGDLLKRSRPGAKVVSIAMKDRAAILMGGRNPDLATWFDTVTGSWITSTYYTSALPDWLRDFNSSQANEPYASLYKKETWRRSTTIVSASEFRARSRADIFRGEASGYKNLFETGVFPHSVEYPHGTVSDGRPYLLVEKSPFGDLVTLEMVKQAIENVELGQDDVPDLLWIGFSAPDLLGHLFGPWSQELMDEYLRLDGVIGALIDHLDSKIGRGEYLLVLTADHGAPPIPDFGKKTLSLPTAWQKKDKFEAKVRTDFARQNPKLKDIIVDSHEDIFGFYFDPAELQAKSITRGEAENALRSVLLEIDGVQAVYTRSDILAAAPGTPFLQAYVNTSHDDRSPDVMVRFDEYRIVSEYDTGTSHGSPYRYDRHVPLIVFGHRSVARTIATPVAPVDIAPTLAELLGIPANPVEPDSKSFLSLTR